jgi:uncharacterized protein (DUF302 family)
VLRDRETTSFVLHRPAGEAVRIVRRALEKEGLEVSADCDLSARVRRAFRIQLPPCRVLYVDSPLALLEALVLDQTAAVVLPLHLVIEGQDGHTLVHMLHPASGLCSRLSAPAKASLSKLQAQVIQAIESVAARHSGVPAVAATSDSRTAL